MIDQICLNEDMQKVPKRASLVPLQNEAKKPRRVDLTFLGSVWEGFLKKIEKISFLLKNWKLLQKWLDFCYEIRNFHPILI